MADEIDFFSNDRNNWYRERETTLTTHSHTQRWCARWL